MNYNEARVYLEQTARYGSVLGLDNMKKLLDYLDNPQDKLKFIHAAGTNGKGSVLSFLSSIMQESGYRIGRYISPTLWDYRERIQINGIYISKEELAAVTTKAAWAAERVMEETGIHPTVFEVETAMSFLYFLEQKCDYCLLETGMGGLEDATNVVKTSVMELITSISMDHMAFLGDTLEQIAVQKAGIIKPDTNVVSAYQPQEAARVIAKKCQKEHCVLHMVDPRQICSVTYGVERQCFTYKEFTDVSINLGGNYQISNACLAIEAALMLKDMGFSVSRKNILAGLEKTVWRGRFTVIHHNPMVVIDGAHNEDAARQLRQTILQDFPDRKLNYLFGVFQDKEYEKIINLTADLADHIITVATPDNPRALPADKLAEAVRKVNTNVESADNIASAVKKGFALAGQDDVILAFGSLSFLNEIVKAVDEEESTNGSGKN